MLTGGDRVGFAPLAEVFYVGALKEERRGRLQLLWCAGCPSHPILYPKPRPNRSAPPQSEISPNRREQKVWPLQHNATRLLREMLGVLDLAEKAGTDDDRSAADRLSRRWGVPGLLLLGCCAVFGKDVRAEG